MRKQRKGKELSATLHPGCYQTSQIHNKSGMQMEKGKMKKSTTRRALGGHSAQWRCADAATPTRRLAWPPSPQQRSSFDGASFAAFAFSELQMHASG